MTTRADRIDEVPAQAVRRIYDAQFLARLGQQFQFDGNNSEITWPIVRMGISYLTHRRLENNSVRANSRRQAAALVRAIRRFRLALKQGEELGLSQLMAIAALQMHNSNSKFRAAEFNDEAYLKSLAQFLDLLESGLNEEIRRTDTKRGPRANLALQTLAIHTAEFFATELNGRPFTIDQHKPFKATQAFDFVKALADPLEAVTQNDIVTAIRSAKLRLKKTGK